MTDPEERYKRHLLELLNELKSLELHSADEDPLEFKVSTVIGGGFATGSEERSMLRKLKQQGLISLHTRQQHDDNFESSHRYFLTLNKDKFDNLYKSLKSEEKQKHIQTNTANAIIQDNYDVIFSLAGEQKQLGQEIKNILASNTLKCWIYTEHEHTFPGKDQTVIFEKLFKEKSDFCVVLISKDYVEKEWPTLEGKYIKDRWMRDENYLIPVIIDDTKLPGLPDLTGYISTKGRSAKEIAEVVMATIRGRKGISTSIKKQQNTKPSYPLPRLTKSFDHTREKSTWIEYIISELKERIGNVDGMEIYSDSAMDTNRIKILLNGDTVYSLDIYRNSTLGKNSIGFFGAFGEIHSTKGETTNAWGNFLWSKEHEDVVLDLFNASMFPVMAEKKKYTKEEFVNEIWRCLVEHLNQNY